MPHCHHSSLHNYCPPPPCPSTSIQPSATTPPDPTIKQDRHPPMSSAAARTLPKDQSHLSRPRPCLPPPSRCRPAPSLSRPPSPCGASSIFGWRQGGVVAVVVIRVRAPHVVKETRRRPASLSSGWGKMTGPPQPPPTMSFPSGHCCDAVRWGQRRERRHGGAATGFGIF